MSGPELCLHKRFDGARCVLNKHVDDGTPINSHAYAYRPVVTEEVWNATHAIKTAELGGVEGEQLNELRALLQQAVERMIKK